MSEFTENTADSNKDHLKALHPLLDAIVKDKQAKGIKTDFNFNGIGIDPEAIKNEAEEKTRQANDAKEKQINRFPVDVFPLSVQEIITSTNENLNFPIDFIGASMLYAASVAIGNTHKVEIKRGFVESAVLYLAIVARAGTNKSHPLSFALQPIVEQDKITYREYEIEMKEYKKALSHWKKSKGKEGIDEPTKPVWKKFLLSDFTPEALAEVHKYNKRGIGVYVDELVSWFKNFNRYNNGSEMEFWLSVWSGKAIMIDRKTGEPVFIPLPFIPVAGTIQTGLLTELSKESRTENGFIDRILFVLLENLQKPYWNEKEIEPEIFKNWQTVISNLLNLSIQLDDTLNPVPQILSFTPEAKQVLFDWQKTNADQCNATKSEAINGIYSKMEMYAPRLALILEMIRFACNEGDKGAVSIESIQGAIKLVEYFKNSAVKVNWIISKAPGPVEKFPVKQQTFYGALPEVDEFTTAQANEIGKSFNMDEKAVQRFLAQVTVFTKMAHGKYCKNYNNWN